MFQFLFIFFLSSTFKDSILSPLPFFFFCCCMYDILFWTMRNFAYHWVKNKFLFETYNRQFWHDHKYNILFLHRITFSTKLCLTFGFRTVSLGFRLSNLSQSLNGITSRFESWSDNIRRLQLMQYPYHLSSNKFGTYYSNAFCTYHPITFTFQFLMLEIIHDACLSLPLYWGNTVYFPYTFRGIHAFPSIPLFYKCSNLKDF